VLVLDCGIVYYWLVATRNDERFPVINEFAFLLFLNFKRDKLPIIQHYKGPDLASEN